MKKNIKKTFSFLMGGDTDERSEFIPIIDGSEELIDETTDIPEILPILPLRNTVLFPWIIFPISVGRTKSLALIKDAYENKTLIGAVAQRNPDDENPTKESLYSIGTMAEVVKVLELPDGTTSAILQGKKRFALEEIIETTPFLKARVTPLGDVKPIEKDDEYKAIVGSLKDLSLKIIKLSINIPEEASFAIKNIENLNFLVNFISSNADVESQKKQQLLEIDDMRERAKTLLALLVRQVQELEMKNDIQTKVRMDIDKQQREYFLNQQIKTIQDELGNNPIDLDIEELKSIAQAKLWSKKVAEHFEKELSKLSRMNPHIGEYSIQLNYLQVMLELPWNEITKDNFDLKRAKKILDKDHSGLDDVKERILEYLAVLKLKANLKTPILCLYGPPGVGKTSLGKSIAESLGRKYVRMSLGGMHDESEIRGHRRTYIGAMPGRIIENIKRAKSDNPVFVLDEIDKLGQSAHGDPSSALLEVLDPEQNSTFHDNFLDLDYDLSKVMFIATANNVANIPAALRDRMEMIEVSGYLIEEKIEIAKKHLIPKQKNEHGIEKDQLTIAPAAIKAMIENYTRESGVRTLDKTIAKVCRNIARKIVSEDSYELLLTELAVREILGPSKFENEVYEGNKYAGVVTGLAWTSVGGTILYVESSVSKGKGKVSITGNLGEVMKESVAVAINYIKAHADELEIKSEVFDNWDIHVHFPEGATPKDGPSAGITLVTSLVSALTQRKVKKNLAMTGEITLRGKVIPVGGIKEKILAAKRAGIKEIILSVDNRKNIEEINEKYIKGLSFHFVSDIMEVVDLALLKQKVDNAKAVV
ncbi:MAG: endopeptidase La [Bacteroidales bacterium]|nr:endopeptidase La [Bacteroidales bacterium]